MLGPLWVASKKFEILGTWRFHEMKLEDELAGGDRAIIRIQLASIFSPPKASHGKRIHDGGGVFTVEKSIVATFSLPLWWRGSERRINGSVDVPAELPSIVFPIWKGRQ